MPPAKLLLERKEGTKEEETISCYPISHAPPYIFLLIPFAAAISS